MKIFLVRHPQTTWNKKGLFQGTKEGKISNEGKLETEIFIKGTRKIKINTIFYAANKRCEYLALKLSRIHPEAEIKKDSRLNERSFGDYEGRKEKEMRKLTNFNPKDYMVRFNWRPPKGESLKDIAPRLREFIKQELNHSKQTGSFFIITSGGVIKVLLFLFGIKTLREIFKLSIGNLKPIRIQIEGDKPSLPA